jgi:hypothetical protein
MRMVVTAKSAEVYGKTLRRGTEFDVPDKEAKLHEALRRARPVQPKPRAAKASDDAGARNPVSTQAAGTYNRRDMRPED